ARRGVTGDPASTRRIHLNNGIAQYADAFDLDFHRVARAQRTDSRRGAGQDHVARLERHHGGDELDEKITRENHVARVAVLADLAVDARLQRERGDVELRLDAWADRREGVEAFAARELHVLLLQVARGDVVRAGEAAHVVAPLRGLHLL